MKQREHDLQKACLKWFKYQHPKYADSIWATPNAGRRTPRNGKYMVQEGMTKGVPDLFIAVPYYINDQIVCAGLFVELKIKPNRLTEPQKNMLEVLNRRGYRAEVCYSFEEFVKIVNNHLLGL